MTDTSQPAEKKASNALISPVVDFLLVGGLSFILIPPLLLFNIPGLNVVAVSIALAYVINDPHFMHSYQLMYEKFGQKLRNQKNNPLIYARYIFAGIIVPALFFTWFGFCVFTKNIQALAYSGNIMILTVGWHYAKQGYGMLIVLSALDKIYYDARTKNTLLVNSYLVWICTWMLFNIRFDEMNIQNFPAKSFSIPMPVFYAVSGMTVITTVLSILFLSLHAFQTRRVSINGLTGYFSSYIWLFIRSSHIILNAVIPVFHSLQYLPFVWKYKFNESVHASGNYSKDYDAVEIIKDRAMKPFRNFILTGLGIGLIAFHIGPALLDRMIPYDHAVFGTNLFLFMIIIFINVHHYFIDNVIWRKENHTVGLYLFSGFRKSK